MNSPKEFSILILVASVLISRILQVNAQKKLDSEKKSQLLDIGNKNQITVLILIGIIFLAFFLIIQNNLFDKNIVFGVYITSILLISLFNIKQIYSSLKVLEFPADFIQSYTAATAIRLSGLIFFLILILQ